MRKNLAFKLGLCPVVLALEHMDHEAKRRYAKLYDSLSDTLIELELPYSIYLLSDIKGQRECWEDALRELGVEWNCPHARECPVKRRQAYQRQEQSS